MEAVTGANYAGCDLSHLIVDFVGSSDHPEGLGGEGLRSQLPPVHPDPQTREQISCEVRRSEGKGNQKSTSMSVFVHARTMCAWSLLSVGVIPFEKVPTGDFLDGHNGINANPSCWMSSPHVHHLSVIIPAPL